jgi:D-alanyl-D-alanine carboxypeptidase/D-alanyl-D-alanine-endopeptidase (penicillin-binding protein 4)
VTRGLGLATLTALAVAALDVPLATHSRQPAPSQQPAAASRAAAPDAKLQADLAEILKSPAAARALVGVRIESLRTGEVLFTSHSDKLVVPASNMKLLTLAAAAKKLGWDHRFETRLEAVGTMANGVLTGDLIVTGSGDPSIGSPDGGHAALFLEWAEALKAAGIREVRGRLIGDDNAFDDTGIGAGWAWDYLDAGYAAPAGALSFNENVVTVRVAPGKAAGQLAAVRLTPPGATFTINNRVVTAAAGTQPSVTLSRLPGETTLTVSGRIPVGATETARVTTIDNPTRYFVESLRLALAERGIRVSEGAFDIDDFTANQPPGLPENTLPIRLDGTAPSRRLIARRESAPLSALGAQFLKVSQNFYGEMFLKAIGRTPERPGTAASGRAAAREILGAWGITPDSFVMSDGSGLSRYDYVTADTIVTLLKRVWEDETLRGPFLAALPVGGHDGTLGSRMRNNALTRRVQAKTGTISNMRALSGYLITDSGERIVFSIIANHYTAPTAEIDEMAEKMLLRLVTR